jgi:hypothetical protein
MKTQNKTPICWLGEFGNMIFCFGTGYLCLSYYFAAKATTVAMILLQVGVLLISIRALLQWRAKKSEKPQD